MKAPSFHRFVILGVLIVVSVLLAASATAQWPTPSPGRITGAVADTAVHPTMGNPAAVYCREMGYEYQIRDDDGQRGFCTLPAGIICDAWEFLQGKCGQSYSYCAQQGYETRTLSDGKDSLSREYAVCVTSEGVVVGSVTELSELSEKATGCGGDTPDGEMPPQFTEGEDYVPPVDADPPAAFDWRTYLGSNWLSPVKNQGSCGSCWAFSAVGVAESAHNIATNNPDLDLDLSEQYLVADCSTAGTCCGGYKDRALQFIRDSGVPDEGCMSYVDGTGCSCDGGTCDSVCTYNTGDSCSDRTCSNRCSDWSSRLTDIVSTGYVGTDPQTIKQALVDIGPLAVSMGYGDDFGGYWNGDIYRCTLDTGTNHAVIAVGYDDVGGYWLIKNSWGTGWGDGGYFKLGYGECYVERYVYYADASQPGDDYEPDDTSGQANWIYDGSPQTHSIDPVGDVDWVKFSLTTESEVVLETSGASGDTRMWLYDSTLTQLDFDDDGGTSLFSYIDRLCDADPLPAGTYYVKIDEYGNDAQIPSYDIDFTVVQACASDVGPLAYDSHLIDDDTSGESDGNGDGIVDCGESIELDVDLINQGSDTATGVGATISTSDSYVTWLDNTSSAYPDISGGGTGNNSDDFDFAVDPGTPNGHIIQFDLNITASNGGPWTDSFDVPVTCSTNNSPYTPSSPSPADGATGESISSDLAWTGGDPDPGDTVTYDVYFGTSNPPTTLLCNDTSSTTCDPGTLAYSTQYFWYVVATDNHGASTLGSVWDFTTTSGGDAYEPDDTWDQANWIEDGSPQTHSIVPADDVDWVMFSLATESEVVLETSGASGDTRMWLYDSGLTQIEFNDDGETNLFSRIDRLCGVDALPAGTYYVKIDEFGNNAEIPSYDIGFTIQACVSDVGPLEYDSHVIDDDMNTSVGDGDGIVDCGETIELNITLANQGTDTATGVAASLSTTDPYITVTDSQEGFPDIAGGGTGEDVSDYDFMVNPTTPDGHIIHFDLDITASNGGPWIDSFDVPVECPMVCSDPGEPNDAAGQAVPISYGVVLTGRDICPAGDVDYYSFSGQAGDTILADIDAQTSGSSLDSYLVLYGTDGFTELAHNDDFDGFDSQIAYTLPAAGTYYLMVREYSHPSEGGPDYAYQISIARLDHAVYLPVILRNQD